VWLVVCSPADRSALWAARGLRARGLAPLEILTPEALVHALHWEQRLDRDGRATSRIVRHTGLAIDGAAVQGVVNRAAALPMIHLARARAEDRAYAASEWAALVSSWLSSLDNVVNLPVPPSLAGSARSAAEWRWLAAGAGLDIEVCHVGEEAPGTTSPGAAAVRVVVLDDRVFGDVPPEIRQACVHLREASGDRLIGLGFAVSAGGPRFLDATPLPDLMVGGEELLDHLSEALRA
jgi:hypothetical protein